VRPPALYKKNVQARQNQTEARIPDASQNRGFGGMAPLLLKIPEEIADCLARAEEASQRAQHETNERLKVEWLDIEHRWRHLAESLKFVDQANRFLDDALHSRSEGRVP